MPLFHRPHKTSIEMSALEVSEQVWPLQFWLTDVDATHGTLLAFLHRQDDFNRQSIDICPNYRAHVAPVFVSPILIALGDFAPAVCGRPLYTFSERTFLCGALAIVIG
jgi:hypothetical protein